MDSITLPPDQTRIYVGPLDDDVIGSDLQQQFVQFGAIRGVSRFLFFVPNYSNQKIYESNILEVFGCKVASFFVVNESSLIKKKIYEQ
jgi:hypothetical protein